MRCMKNEKDCKKLLFGMSFRGKILTFKSEDFFMCTNIDKSDVDIMSNGWIL